MSQTEKAELYKELKEAGVQFSKHYREYSTADLQEAVDRLRASRPAPAQPETDLPSVAEVQEAVAAHRAADNPPARRPAPQAADPDEMPSQRLNSKPEDEPIRVDENGLVWYQEEVLKPAVPKPRGRRVLKYLETGVEQQTTQAGEYVETFEVAGRGPARPAEVKITLPSYQVGIYKDPRFPFKIHTYDGRRGFDLFEVQKYYGGSELVPAEIKRVYVENVLCYDIRTTVRSIQTEYRQLQLAGKV